MRDIIQIEKKTTSHEGNKKDKESTENKEVPNNPSSTKENDNSHSQGWLWKIFIVVFSLLPLFFIPGGVITFGISKTAFLIGGTLIVAFIWLLKVLSQGEIQLPRHPFFIALFSLPFIYLLSALLSGSFNKSFTGSFFETDTVLMVLLLSFIVFLTALLLSSSRKKISLYKGLFISFVVVALFQVAKLVLGLSGIGFSLGVFPDVTSNLIGKWNDLGMYAGLFMILSLITLEMPLERIQKWLTYSVFLLSLALLVVVNFQLAWILVGVFSLLYFVYTFSFGLYYSRKMKEKDTSNSFQLRPLVIFIISLVFVVGGTFIDNSISSFFNISQVEVRPSWNSTLSVANDSFTRNPLLGSGPNTFREQWILYKAPEVNETIFWNTNFNSGIGLIPTSLVSVGALGVLAWLAVFIYLIYLGFRHIGRDTNDPQLVYLETSSFVGAIFGWILFFFYIPSIVMIALTFLLMGVFVSVLKQKGTIPFITISGSSNQREAFLVSFIAIALLIGTIGWLYSGGTRLIASAYYQKGLNAVDGTESINRVRGLFEKAIRYHSSDIYYRALTDVSLAQLNQIVAQTEIDEDQLRSEFQAQLADTIENAQATIELNRSNYQNWMKLGDVYAAVAPLQIQGAHQSAVNRFNQAAERNPQSPEIDLKLARLEASLGNLDAARENITRALEKKGNYTEAVFLLSQIEAQSGNIPEAIQATESAALLVPNDPTIYFQLGLLYYNQGNYVSATQPLERAIELFPEYSNAKYFLGLSLVQQGRTGEAIEQFRDLKRLNPENTEIEVILENLENGLSPFEGSDVSAPEEREELPIEEE